MQEYSRRFASEYLPELRREPGLTESSGQILVWLKYKTNNLTGGTINTAANVVCNWPVIRDILSDHMPIQNKHENLS